VFADLDETIRQLLIRHVPLDLAEVDVSFDAPDREWSGRLTRPTVNLFLYDVRENKDLHEAMWEVGRDAKNGSVSRRKLPLRINAIYNVTVWARAPEDEHRLLWRVLAALSRHATLPADLAHGGLQAQPFPVLAKVAQPEQARTNPADLWQAVDNRIRPSLTYVVTLALEPDTVFISPMVFTSSTRTRSTLDDDDDKAEAVELIRVGGRVFDRASAAPIAKARVTWRERGVEATTDATGAFAFVQVPPGKLTLAVTAPGRKEVSKLTDVPAPNYDVEV
jgi:hypothetical protein